MLNKICFDFDHDWIEVYNGIKCIQCGLFYPDNGNYFAPLDDDEEGRDDFHISQYMEEDYPED